MLGVIRVSRCFTLNSQQVFSRCRPRRVSQGDRRFASGYQASKTATIPERLQIFHTGTGRTVFIGCLKVTTIFLFVGNLFLNVPRMYSAPDYPLWYAPAVAVGGAIPMLYMIWASAPFVAYVHIRLPMLARRSKEQLLRWSESIPSNTELDLTTIKWYGRPRVSRIPISDLKPTKASFGIENLVRKQKALPGMSDSTRKAKGQRLFFVGNDPKKSIETSVWRKVTAQIQAN